MKHRFIVEVEGNESLNWEDVIDDIEDCIYNCPDIEEECDLIKIRVYYQDDYCINIEREKLRKSVAHKVSAHSDGTSYCEDCGNVVKSCQKYCHECGQRLDWGERLQ